MSNKSADGNNAFKNKVAECKTPGLLWNGANQPPELLQKANVIIYV